MKFALLNNERIEPQKGIKNAICPVCKEPVEACCGPVRIHYWRHKQNHKQHCDPWWENETEWHRQWKDNFPKECQEIIMHDEKTGEKHVADVKTKTGIVLEFHHSSMNEDEQDSREQFYKNMIWVVDARQYYDRFKKYIDMLNHSKINKNYFYMHIDYYEEHINCFPKRWLEATVPVIFDFGIYYKTDDDYDKQKKWLWCVFPEKYQENLGYSYDETICGLYLKKETFINQVSNFDKFYSNIVISELEQLKKQIDAKKLEEERRFKEELRRQEEFAKRQRQELFNIKYPKEEKWRNAISNIKLNIKDNKLNPIKLQISKDGEILDYNNHKYNGKKYMIIGVKSYSAEYNGKNYIKNDVLILVQNNNEIITAIINVPTYILKGSGWYDSYGLLDGNYNYYIRTMTTIPYYDKYALWSEDDDRIWTTKKLKEDLEYIEKNYDKIK